MHSKAMFLALLVLLSLSACSATYNLKASWYGGEIISNFSYFTGADPTHGMPIEDDDQNEIIKKRI